MQVKRSKIIALSAAFFWACVFLFRYGYQFNIGDHEEHLPQIYKLISPELYPKDYFINAPENGFTLRFLYVKLVYFLQFIVPIKALSFSLLLLCLSTMAYYIHKIARLAGIPFFTAIFVPGIVFLIAYYASVGGVRITYNLLLSSVIAKSIGLVGMYLMLSKKYYQGAIVLGITSLFHVMNGAQIMLICTVALLFDERGRNFKSLFLAGLLFLGIGSTMIIPMLASQIEVITLNPRFDYKQIMYEVRNPHHFFWKHFPLVDKIAFLVLNFAAVITIITTKQKDLFVNILGVILGLLVINFILFDQLNSWFLGNFQLYKLSIYATIISTIILFRGSKFRNYPISYRNEKQMLIAFPLVSVLLLSIILNGELLPKGFSSRYKIGNYQKTSLEEMHLWITNNTPLDALFLNDPADNSFACEAKRSQAIAFTAIVHKPSFMYRWMDDIETYYGASLNDLRNGNPKQVLHDRFYHKLKKAEIPNNIDYLLVNEQFLTEGIPSEYELDHQIDNWILLRLKNSKL